MTPHAPMSAPALLHGRGAELRATAAVTAAPGTEGAVLVVTGGPGLGRTALLDHAARAFRAGPVLHVRGAHREPRPSRSGVDSVRWAARALRPGPPEDAPAAPLGDGLLLDLLRDTAAGAPLLVCVDDVHLWDAASRAALGYAARRPHLTGPVRLLVSVAGHRAADPHLAGLPSLPLAPLPDADAGALLDELTGGRTAETVRAELLHAAEGNPALLHALVRRLSAAELGGERALPWPLVDAEVVRGLVDDGPDGPLAGHRDLLLVAAAAQRCDPDGAGVRVEPVLDALTRVAPPGGAAA
ncbi:ATP-binding protein, partial [Streptomyces sp. CRN 30]|uniref:ATP-binding protein n=1 Tax=Streptomyces sp. CRN 30 TaxID=3075613 RepID=UPI002A7F380D